MRTSNPALNEKTFGQFGGAAEAGRTMTVQGAVDKTGVLLALVLAAAFFTWHQAFAGVNVIPWMMGGIIGGAILALVTIFKVSASPITAPLYAICEGLALGGISAMAEASYPGLPMQAVCLTAGTLACMLVAYRAGWIRATQGLIMGIVSATGAIALFYLAAMVLNMFGIGILNSVFGAGPIGIGFSFVVVAIAALNLILDFEVIVQGANYNAPKYMEWYGAFGLLVTLVWLYIEILRLLIKLRGRD